MKDIQKTIAFSKEHTVCLVVRSSSHDYNGKSIGVGSPAVRTQGLRAMEFINDYEGTF